MTAPVRGHFSLAANLERLASTLVAVALFVIAVLALGASRALPFLDDVPGVVKTVIVLVGVSSTLAGVHLWLPTTGSSAGPPRVGRGGRGGDGASGGEGAHGPRVPRGRWLDLTDLAGRPASKPRDLGRSLYRAQRGDRAGGRYGT